MEYTLTQEDFDKAFNFALGYWLDPSKPKSTRTTGNARGFGGVSDSFLLGKLVEIGVVKILESVSKDKNYGLDFDIKKAGDVLNEADIIAVIESKTERKPNVFVEIKNVLANDRWVGLTKEQFETIKRSSGDKDIYIIGASIQHQNTNLNQKQTDLLGTYLKSLIKDNRFAEFADMDSLKVKIEYVISGDELDKVGIEFKKGELMYETEIFEEAGPMDSKGIASGKIPQIKGFRDSKIENYSPNPNYPPPVFSEPFTFEGKIEIYEKTNEKSLKRFIVSKSNVIVYSPVFGKFPLEQGKIYFLNTTTSGRNPVLARNNIWIAKRNIPYLQTKGQLKSVKANLKELVGLI